MDLLSFKKTNLNKLIKKNGMKTTMEEEINNQELKLPNDLYIE